MSLIFKTGHKYFIEVEIIDEDMVDKWCYENGLFPFDEVKSLLTGLKSNSIFWSDPRIRTDNIQKIKDFISNLENGLG